MDGAGKQFNDLWEFDGKKWDSIPVSGANPGSRISSGYAYDSKRGLLIIFGGISGQDIRNDTWSWNGKHWKQFSTLVERKQLFQLRWITGWSFP